MCASRLKLKSGIKGNKKYSINEEVFKKRTIEECYWAGFIAADGCIQDTQYKTGQQNRLTINLSKLDKKHLEYLKDFMKSDHKISIKKNNTVRLDISSNKICNTLRRNFNVTPRKSLTLIPPQNLTKKQILAFIKGYVDGDGSISIRTKIDKRGKGYSYKSLVLKITGTKPVLKWIQTQLSFYVDISDLKLHLCKGAGKTYALVINGKRAKFAAEIINNSVKFGLERKWQKLNQLKNQKSCTTDIE